MSDHASSDPSLVPSLARVMTATRDDDPRVAIWSAERPTTWGELAQQFAETRQAFSNGSGQRVGIPLSADAASFAALAALQSLGRDAFLFDATVSRQQQAEWAKLFALDAIVDVERACQRDLAALANVDHNSTGDRAERVDDRRPSSVTILTSGTTGVPKAVQHSWDGLARPVRLQAKGDTQRWLLAFRPHLYAGLQVALQALLNRSTLVAPGPTASPGEAVDLMIHAGVQYASATPSYWRRLLMSVAHDQLAKIPLTQVTLGGEVADQPILDHLAALYPAARIAHIYATTELGRCFSVTDRRAGFPADYLAHPTRDGVELKIFDSQLWVRSTNAMLGYDSRSDSGPSAADDGWFPTQDLVDAIGDRVHFVGRKSDMINVGGNKVYPLVVERVIRQVAEVADVRVFGVASSVAGQLVACEVVIDAQASMQDWRLLILEHCRQHLDRYQCPRVVTIVDQLPLTTAGKLAR